MAPYYNFYEGIFKGEYHVLVSKQVLHNMASALPDLNTIQFENKIGNNMKTMLEGPNFHLLMINPSSEPEDNLTILCLVWYYLSLGYDWIWQVQPDLHKWSGFWFSPFLLFKLKYGTQLKPANFTMTCQPNTVLDMTRLIATKISHKIFSKCAWN